MASLDLNYVGDLVRDAQSGDSNAFAELYAATCQNQYRFSLSYLEDRYLAQDAVQEIYIAALTNLNKLRDPSLFIAWLNQISFRVCFRIRKQRERRKPVADDGVKLQDSSLEDEIVSVKGRRYYVRQIMNLPFTESQVILLRFDRHMRVKQITQMMEINRGAVQAALVSGIHRLYQLPEAEGGKAK